MDESLEMNDKQKAFCNKLGQLNAWLALQRLKNHDYDNNNEKQMFEDIIIDFLSEREV